MLSPKLTRLTAEPTRSDWFDAPLLMGADGLRRWWARYNSQEILNEGEERSYIHWTASGHNAHMVGWGVFLWGCSMLSVVFPVTYPGLSITYGIAFPHHCCTGGPAFGTAGEHETSRLCP